VKTVQRETESTDGPGWILLKAVALTQSLVTLGVATLAVLFDVAAVYSAVLGGGSALVISIYFGVRVMRRPPEGPPQEVAGQVYRAEVAKLLISSALFAAVFALTDWLNGLAFFSAFGLAYLSGGVVALAVSSKVEPGSEKIEVS